MIFNVPFHLVAMCVGKKMFQLQEKRTKEVITDDLKISIDALMSGKKNKINK